MAGKYSCCIFICLFLLFSNINTLQTQGGKIKISTGTASGCSDTVRFIASLVETYAEYKDFLELEFVPWGRTRRDDDGSLICQFGVNDCWANRLHRCILNMLEGNQDAQLQYLACEFSSPFPSFLLGSYQCAQTTGLNLVTIDNCVIRPGDEIDRAAEEAAAEPMEIINFVPTIVFNDVIDVALHTEARTRLKSMVCFALADDPTSGITNCEI